MNKNLDNFEIFPNPSEGLFTISSDFKTEAKIEIFSSLGKSVFKSGAISSKEIIDLSSLAKGVYFLKIETDNGSLNQKLIIQ